MAPAVIATLDSTLGGFRHLAGALRDTLRRGLSTLPLGAALICRPRAISFGPVASIKADTSPPKGGAYRGPEADTRGASLDREALVRDLNHAARRIITELPPHERTRLAREFPQFAGDNGTKLPQ